MSMLTELIFGSGGASGHKVDPAAGFEEYLEFLKGQQADLELEQDREEERADVMAASRRGELADRTGFSGLVNVGDAVERSDATLASEMAGLSADDPSRVAYDDALAAEAEQEAANLRIASGEQYDVEDTLRELEERIQDREVKAPGAQKELDRIKAENPWADTAAADTALADAQAEEERRAAEEERRRRIMEAEDERRRDPSEGGL